MSTNLHFDRGRRAAWIRLAAVACALAAFVCCNIGPAWSPDGKSVVFAYPVDDERMGLARCDLETGEVTALANVAPGSLMRATYGPDGVLYALRVVDVPAEHEGEGAGEDGVENDGEDEDEDRVVEVVRVDGDAARVLATFPDGSADLLPMAPLFVADGHVWTWVPQIDEEDSTGSDEHVVGDDDDSVLVVCVDVETGAIRYPFGALSRFLLAGGPGGLYYLEAPGDDEGPMDFGRVSRAEDGVYEREVLRRFGPGVRPAAMQPIVVGRESVVVIVGHEADEEDAEPGAGHSEAGRSDADRSEADRSEDDPSEDGDDDRTEAVHMALDGSVLGVFPTPAGKVVGGFAMTADERWLCSTVRDGAAMARMSLADGRVESFPLEALGLPPIASTDAGEGGDRDAEADDDDGDDETAAGESTSGSADGSAGASEPPKAVGISASPVGARIALQLFPDEDEDIGKVPALLVVDLSAATPRGVAYWPPK